MSKIYLLCYKDPEVPGQDIIQAFTCNKMANKHLTENQSRITDGNFYFIEEVGLDRLCTCSWEEQDHD